MTSRLIQEITVNQAPAVEGPVLDHLLQLYLHDFSELAALGSPHGEVDEKGLFAYHAGLARYWREPGEVPLLIRADGRIAGFMLLNRWSALDHPLDHAVAEFFVLRKYRRARVGTRAAHHVFRQYAGRWEVPVAGYNQAALLFWRAVAGLFNVPRVTEHAGDGKRWSGTVLCFDTGSTASAPRTGLT